MQKYYRGFSLMELVVVLAIIAIMASIGIPSFNSVIRSTKLATVVNEFIGTLNFARSEAVKRNQRIVVRKNENCTTKTNIVDCDWEDGWVIFVETTSPIDGELTINNQFKPDGQVDDKGNNDDCLAGLDCILQLHEALPGVYKAQPPKQPVDSLTYTLRGNNNFKNFIAYTPMGLSNTLGRFVLCNNTDKNKATVDGANSLKLVLVNILGRVRVSTADADKDGIPEDDSTPPVEQATCTPP